MDGEEYFRCDPLEATLRRRQCAARYSDAQTTSAIGYGECRDCPIGKSHSKGRVPPGAPAVDAPTPASSETPVTPPKKQRPVSWKLLRRDQRNANGNLKAKPKTKPKPRARAKPARERTIMFRGVTRTVEQWARRHGQRVDTIIRRQKRGLRGGDAIFGKGNH